MIKIEVKNLSGVATHVGVFPTQNEAESWYAQNRLVGSFGKIGGWFPASKLTQEEIDAAIESMEVENPFPREGEPATYMLYRFNDSFTFTLTDVTTEKQQEEKELKSSRKIIYGNHVKIYINSVNNDKIDNAVWTQEIIASYLSDANVSLIERFLGFGALTFAYDKIANTDLSAYYTNTEKATILDKLDGFITLLGD